MGILVGKDELINNYNAYKDGANKKGLAAEVLVAEKLEKMLNPDTFIICQPDVGEAQPDFLIISKLFGFRLVEVKNYSLNYIEDVFSNGALKIKGTISNPLVQVRNHAEKTYRFLSNNFTNYIGNDVYKKIGYCVIHAGFTKAQFESKFFTSISKWSEKEKNDFFKYNIFLNQLTGILDETIENAVKFRYSSIETCLEPINIRYIVDHIKIGSNNDKNTFTADDLKEIIQSEIKNSEYIKSLKRNNDDLDNSYFDNKSVGSNLNGKINPEIHNNITETKPKSNNFVLVLVGAIFIFGVLSFSYYMDNMKNNTSQSNYSNFDQSTKQDEISESGENFSMECVVEDFYYDNESKIKYLTLNTGSEIIYAAIDKDTKVPYINEGESYIFTGSYENTDENMTFFLITMVE